MDVYDAGRWLVSLHLLSWRSGFRIVTDICLNSPVYAVSYAPRASLVSLAVSQQSLTPSFSLFSGLWVVAYRSPSAVPGPHTASQNLALEYQPWASSDQICSSKVSQINHHFFSPLHLHLHLPLPVSVHPLTMNRSDATHHGRIGRHIRPRDLSPHCRCTRREVRASYQLPHARCWAVRWNQWSRGGVLMVFRVLKSQFFRKRRKRRRRETG